MQFMGQESNNPYEKRCDNSNAKPRDQDNASHLHEEAMLQKNRKAAAEYVNDQYWPK
jgi:hypothetical protein